MSEKIQMSVALLSSDDGMVGRECPQCHKYFKLKPGTGLDTTVCVCPYCEHEDDPNEFLTKAQLEFIKSLALRQMAEPIRRELQESFRTLERDTRHSLISFKVRTTGFDLPVKYYSEKDLETNVTCDKCGLDFAIYGVFATCPHCKRLTTMAIFRASLRAAKKRLPILDMLPSDEADLREGLLTDTLSSGVSAFDALGKRLRSEFPGRFPRRRRNLFQNLKALASALRDGVGVGLDQLLEPKTLEHVSYMFQVRHLWIHSFGEADEDFVRETGAPSSLCGTKIIPSPEEVAALLDALEELGVTIRDQLS